MNDCVNKSMTECSTIPENNGRRIMQSQPHDKTAHAEVGEGGEREREREKTKPVEKKKKRR